MRSFGDAFSNAFLGAYQMFSAAEERKKQDEAAKMYFNMMAEDAQRKVQPYEDKATQAQFGANWADSNVAAANAPITTSPDKLADTRSTRFLTMTPQERLQAGLSQAQSDAIDKQMQGEGPVNMQQIQQGGNGVPSLQSTLQPVAARANMDAQQAQATLGQMQQRYGTEMFGKLGALVEKGMDPRMAMKIADSHIEKAAVAAEKQQLNAYFKVFSDPKATDQDRQAAAAGIASLKPQMAGMFGNLFGLKQQSIHGTVKLENGNLGIVDAAGNIKDTGQKFYQDKTMTPYQQATLGLRRQELSLKEQKDPKKPEWEKEHLNYEKTHGVNDAQAVQEYWAVSNDPAQASLITPDKQAKYNAATARVNKYLSQPNLTADEQAFLAGIDKSKVSKEEGFKMLQQYRMNKLNGIRQ